MSVPLHSAWSRLVTQIKTLTIEIQTLSPELRQHLADGAA